MSVLQGWMPPTRERWESLLTIWQIVYPIIGNCQWAIPWYGMGKTSVVSRLNVPGRVAWFMMESPGFLTLLYIMNTLPRQLGIMDLPWQNKVLAGLFVIHYSYRAVLFPYLQPSMSPIHIFVATLALGFQLCNATSLGGWLAGYGPTTAEDWAGPYATLRFTAGIAIFYLGLAGNYFHDDELREIRRQEQRRVDKLKRQDPTKAEGKGGVEKHYRIPEAGLFRYMLYPHYFCEWIEWLGYWMAAGWGCVPARAFLVNELLTMFPRAVRGRWWYEDKFGKDKIWKKWTAIPGLY